MNPPRASILSQGRRPVARALAATLATAALAWSLAPSGALAQSSTDYDSDDDGLIEITSLAQLDAVRWDLDGDGAVASDDTTNYTAAFSSAAAGMGCPTNATDADDNDCTGYELTADLDFDTDGDGAADSGDTYWNGGKGWTPIGSGTGANSFTATFEGNGHIVSNIHIHTNLLTGHGLFGYVGNGGLVRRVGMEGGSVTNTASGNWSGGLAGVNGGTIEFSYSSVAVNGPGAGGLVGWNIGGAIKSSYATGSIGGAGPGGLVYENEGGRITDSYAAGAVISTGSGANDSDGGLALSNTTSASIANSYSTGGDKLVKSNTAGTGTLATVTASYWDSTLGASAAGVAGVAKTTAELKAPVSSAGIYADWDDAKWDFGTACDYPALKADWNGDGIATWAEFGDQARSITRSDLDCDDNGLIEIVNLAQLNAVRWDLDGNGKVASGDRTKYVAAFGVRNGTGCNADAAQSADRVCDGYELNSDLDFDSDGDGDVDASDHGGAWWDGGKGWRSISSVDGEEVDNFAETGFTGEFDGRGHTIHNLFIYRSPDNNSDGTTPRTNGRGGLFGLIDIGGEVKNLGLADVDITVSGIGSFSGALAGRNKGAVEFVYSSGNVLLPAASRGITAARVTTGGLVGENAANATIKSSYSKARVTGAVGVGGLVGTNRKGIIENSYATGKVDPESASAFIGGLVGDDHAATAIQGVVNSYVTGPTAILNRGPLFSTGGPIVGDFYGGLTTPVRSSYWDTDTTGIEASFEASAAHGVGKTTSQLTTPTSNTGIYSAWPTAKWDFRTAGEYPALKADWDGDGTATWQEFGNQYNDYDDDDDGLIDVNSLLRLDAIRYDLDGDGSPSSGNEAAYAAAFPNPVAGMGCPINGDDADDHDCTGYELSADLDFDSDGDGDVDADDHDGDWWDTGKGWDPIGAATLPFTAEFDGNGHTIAHMDISRASGGSMGLFASMVAGGRLRNVGLTDVAVAAAGDSKSDIGALVGANQGGAISGSYASGAVTNTTNDEEDTSSTGGLVGYNEGSITGSYADVQVSSSTESSAVGGLVGENRISFFTSPVRIGTITDSYATGRVTDGNTLSSQFAPSYAGGLAGTNNGLITNSYATGAVRAVSGTAGGLVGANFVSDLGGTVTASHWDTQTSGVTTSGAGSGQTTWAMRAPTAPVDIYSGWSAAVWDFGTYYEYPLLKTDFDGDGEATAAEFGSQPQPADLKVDYDHDDDGLIAVVSLAHLDAIRHDLDGDGAVSADDQTAYDGAFADAADGMGCPTNATDADDNDCTGYELSADLDFDTDGDGDVDTNDAHWNSGAGWTPIDDFATTLEGNGHTISNLFINATSGAPGLFDTIAAAGEVRNLGLIDVDVSSSAAGSNNRVGTLAGALDGGDVSFVYVSGGTVARTVAGDAGGLIGGILIGGGSVKSSWSSAAVSAVAGISSAGGLIGVIAGGSIADSYATGAVTNTGSGARAGGLAGLIFGANISIDDSYATGAVSGANTGGLVGGAVGGTVTTSYWDTATTGQTTSGGGTGKTTSELQTPTSNTGIYSAWSTDKWDFVDANHFPFLKADWDATSGATWQEFGDQDPAPAFADDASIADVELTQDAAYTGAALPAATGGNGPKTYSLTPRPAGLSMNAERKLTGTPTAPLAKTQITYAAADTDGDTDTLTFNLSIKPKAATLTGTAGNTTVALTWAAIPGVSGWEVKQGSSGSWTAITGSDDTTAGHTATGLTNNTAYTFRVRAHVGTGDARADGVQSNAITATPLGSLDNTPVLAEITDKTYVQGATVDETLPAATSGDGHPDYDYTLTPVVSGSGLTFTPSTHKLTGTPSTPKAKISYTYTAAETTDSDGTTESASKTFTIGIQPKKPAGFTATSGDTEAILGWTAIAGVAGWEVKQDSGSWTAISSSGGSTNSHTVTGLTNGTEYTFKVRALVGDSSASPSTQVIGVESDAASATPVEDLVPALTDIADKTYVQGAAVDFTLPTATGGDGHPSYDYTLTPAVSGIGLTFTASTRKLGGTPSTPKAKVTYTYTATESSDSDDTVESASKTFTIGIQPKATTLSGSPGNGAAHLSWTAIAGVSGWEYLQNEKGLTTNTTWTAITGSGATTAGHKITGLDNAKEYDFKVRAHVGSGGTLVNGVESNKATVDVADQTPTLSGSIADQELTQGTLYTSAAAFPAGTGGDAPLGYSVDGLPADITLNSDRKLTGTAPAPLAKSSLTYTVTDAAGDANNANDDDTRDIDTLTFNISVAPEATTLNGTPGNGVARLSWTAIAGVAGWEYLQNEKGLTTNTTWTAIMGSGATTAGRTVTGLDNAKEYDFKVRAHVGSGGTLVNGAESNKATVDVADQTPTLTGSIADQELTQGTLYTSAAAFPAGTGGDAPLGYSVDSLPNGITLNSDRKLTGTAPAPLAKSSFTYTVTDAAGDANNANDDDTRDIDTLTFNISVAPEATTLNGTPGNGVARLSWTAIAGVAGWEYLQNEKGLTTNTTWTAIMGSGATTAGRTVTGLDNAKVYDFKVRAHVGSGGTLVNGAESNKATVDVADQTPSLSGSIADQELTQGTLYTSAAAFPAGTGGDAPLGYSVDGLPADITLNSDRKLTGTAPAPLAKSSFTYTATDAAGDANNANDDDTRDTASLTFNISVAPKKPANFTAAAGDAKVTLDWTAIAGVASWEVEQDSGSWTAITGSDDTTNSHTVTGLTNGTAHTFRVRAVVGSGNTLVNGVESDAETATPSADLTPALATVADKVYPQGAAVDFTLPAATGGDGHPNYTYTLTPAVSGSGLTFTASTRKLGGTPSTPREKVTYTYTATESSDSDDTVESASKTFTIGIQPKKPANFAAAAGDTEVVLGWAAIAGVTSWEVQQDGGSWTAVADSGAGTSGHTVTGLANGTAYAFKVRSLVGAGGAQVIGVESDAVSATPSEDLVPLLSGVIADQELTQGAAYVSAAAFPAAVGGDGAITYSVDGLPGGVTLSAARVLSGTAAAPLARTALTYRATDAGGDEATLAFNISVRPNKPAGLAASAGDERAVLSWTAIAGVSGWEYQQGSDSWTAIAGSGAATSGHTVTGLTNGTEYTFRVRALVGDSSATPSTQVIGVESDAVSAAPSAAPPTRPRAPLLPPQPTAPTPAEALDTARACAPAGASSAGFQDLAGWPDEFSAAVDCIAADGVTSGTTPSTYSPKKPVTRGQAALFLTRVVSKTQLLPAPDAGADTGEWQGEHADAATQLGLLGIADVAALTAAGPHTPISRGELALYAKRTLQHLGAPIPSAPAERFNDLYQQSAEIALAARQLADTGIMIGTTDTDFSPDAHLTRAQMALILARMFTLLDITAG